MEQAKQQFVQRAPRYGIEGEAIRAAGLDLAASTCRFTRGDGSSVELGVFTLVNMSSGGIKLTVVNPDRHELQQAEMHYRIAAPGAGKEYVLRGTVCWSEELTAGNFWIGVELKPRPDVLHLLKALTGHDS